eukprot:gene9706-6802_t
MRVLGPVFVEVPWIMTLVFFSGKGRFVKAARVLIIIIYVVFSVIFPKQQFPNQMEIFVSNLFGSRMGGGVQKENYDRRKYPLFVHLFISLLFTDALLLLLILSTLLLKNKNNCKLYDTEEFSVEIFNILFLFSL